MIEKILSLSSPFSSFLLPFWHSFSFSFLYISIVDLFAVLAWISVRDPSPIHRTKSMVSSTHSLRHIDRTCSIGQGCRRYWPGQFLLVCGRRTSWRRWNHCQWILRPLDSVSFIFSFDHQMNMNWFPRTYVTFDKSTRSVGQASKAMEVTNAKNTIYNFKRLLGRRYYDMMVQQEKELNAYSIVEGNGSSVNIEVIIGEHTWNLDWESILVGQLSQWTQTFHSRTDHWHDVFEVETYR